MNERKIYDVIIIGGGPVGIFTSFYAGMRGMTAKIIDSLPELGGQLNALYPEKNIYDIPGYSVVSAEKLVKDLYQQAKQFKPEVELNTTVRKLERKNDLIKIETDDGYIHLCKTAIITAGRGSFKPRKLQLPNIERFEQTNLKYFIDDIDELKGKKVVILGGGDSAVDWALMLKDSCDSVSLVHRRKQFRAHEHSVEALYKSSVLIYAPYEVKDVIGDGDTVSDIVIKCKKTSKVQTIKLDYLVVNYGFVASLGSINDWGLEIEKNSIKVNSRMETNIEGVFAAGDITKYDGKIKLIVNGFGEATCAVSHAKAYIDGSKVLAPHSTHIFERALTKY